MAEMLLINPRRRKAKAKRAAPKRRRNPVRTVKHATARAANPVRTVRRRNPLRVSRRVIGRRRRNPINLGGLGVSSFVTMIKDAAIGGAGAIGMDMLMGRANAYLPASLRSTPGTVNAGTAVKAVATAVLGVALSKITRGLSRKAASGALATQARDVIACFIPGTMAMGYASPAVITNTTQRVGPVRSGMNAYMKPGRTALLNGAGVGAYMAPNVTPLLNRMPARLREQQVR